MSVQTMNRLAAACIALALLVVAAAALLRAAQAPRFALRQIDVRGDLRHVTAASVRTAVAGRLRGTYFTVRLDDARSAFEGVPWVSRASVRRVWPDRLLVTLTEHRALGIWDDGRLLSDRGELFVANPDEAEIYGALPAFSGPADSAGDAVRRYYEFSAKLATLSLRIDAIDISARRAWALRVSDEAAASETRIELGRDSAQATMSQRVQEIVDAYPAVLAFTGGPPARIDARYANGFAAMPATAARPDREPRQ